MNLTTSYAAIALLLLGAAATQAQASTIDTGTPPSLDMALVLDGSNWLAGEISFAQAAQIQSINAYVNDMGAGGTFSIALYSDSATHLPGTLLNSWSASFGSASGTSGWNGVSNLNQAVAAGNYWVALEVQSTDSFSGVAPVAPPSPLAKYAFNDGSYLGYQAMAQGFGLQVAAVPEPESLALMLAGLGLVGAALRRKNHKSGQGLASA